MTNDDEGWRGGEGGAQYPPKLITSFMNRLNDVMVSKMVETVKFNQLCSIFHLRHLLLAQKIMFSFLLKRSISIGLLDYRFQM